MPFYVRKSIKFGPLRLNLSKSGVGVSAGVKGLRVGVGPRGNYIHAGRGGIYYRKTISNNSKSAITESRSGTAPVLRQQDQSDLENYEELESGSVLLMVDGSSAELLEEINGKHKLIRVWPIATALMIALIIIGFGQGLDLLGAGAFVCMPIVCLLALTLDKRRRTTVLFYDLEPEYEAAYKGMYDAFMNIRECNKIWHIEGKGNFRDPKYHAGATTGIKRRKISLTENPPKIIKTNLPVPTFDAGRQQVCFFPDKVLVFEKNQVGAVSYSALRASVDQQQFIEEDNVPNDAKIIDRTWRYVNKKGGPDRRFKDNPQLPVVLYEELALSSATGLREHFHFSRIGTLGEFKSSLSTLKNV